jgi:Fuc2NAc and GlcNAc transferase
LLAAATAAFIIRNWSPARIFLGDVGSLFLGFLLAALPFTGAVEERPRLVFLVTISMALFLLDPVATLVARSRRGERWGAAHREHAYQQLFDPDGSHRMAVTGLLAIGILLSMFGALAYRRVESSWVAIGAVVIAFATEWRLARARRRHRV